MQKLRFIWSWPYLLVARLFSALSTKRNAMSLDYAPNPSIDRFIDDKEQKALTNLSRTTRWRLERQGRFPRTYKLSTNRSARLLSEVVAWMQARRGEAA
jgi:prophage regulatory protein